MKNFLLSKIIESVKIIEIVGNTDLAISSLILDSRKVEKSSVFFAIKGEKTDGHLYIDASIEKGASVIVCEDMPTIKKSEVTYIQVNNVNIAMAEMAHNHYDKPSKKMIVVGITGTNGKTTSATLLYEMVTNLGYESGLISTVIIKIGKKSIETKLTTPDVLTLSELMNEMVQSGCKYCFMEVSSHSLVQNRVNAIDFDGGVFSNLTHDHLDYHKTFGNYIAAKKLFFDRLKKDAFAIVNIDDKNGTVMLQNCIARKQKTYSLQSMSDFKARIVEAHFDGTLLNIDGQEVWVNFIGKFNAYNLLSIYATARMLDFDKNSILTELSKMKPVAGRFEFVHSESGKTGIVDYAHTPDALINVIKSINELRKPEQKLITVIGCGGDRDRTKRPIMAKIAAETSDIVILTSDNPRTEDPEQILIDMEAGVSGLFTNYIKITNRKDAIKTAAMMAKDDDIILIAGKGHEKYQEINGVRHHFDDKEEIKNIVNIK